MSFLNKRIQFMRTRKNGREPSRFPTDGVGVPLRITRLFPMKLKDVSIESLTEAKSSTNDVVCISEMMSLFACFEKHDFDRNPCQETAKILENCYTRHMTEKLKIKEAKAKKNR